MGQSILRIENSKLRIENSKFRILNSKTGEEIIILLFPLIAFLAKLLEA